MPAFDTLDVLGSFGKGSCFTIEQSVEPKRFREVVDVNLNSLMECCNSISSHAQGPAGGLDHHHKFDRQPFTRHGGNPAYGASKDRPRRGTDA